MLYNVERETVEFETLSDKGGKGMQDMLRDFRIIGCGIKKRFDASEIKAELDSVTGTHGWVIGYLADNSDRDVYQKDLEKQFGLSRSTTSKMLAMMEKKGLIGREKVACDDRLKKLVLTEKALVLADKLTADRQQTFRKLTKGFSEDEITTLGDFLTRMKENIL